MSLIPGTSVGPYRIVAHLGAGGMGEVYRAHDPRLGRDVALKVLPAEMAHDPARLERFTREARAIAALNHPHIVTIYSTEEADGIRFLTMELVEGQSLDMLIPPGGLPIARFLELAVPLADALGAAHQKLITHRDLKPANVMVASDGRVKVLDFGLASAPAKAGAHTEGREGPGFSPASLVTSPQVTTPGTILGTMPYMSPEQVEGKPLDHRTDLFSLGVMFHEMLTGARPFGGDSSAQLMSSILRDMPPRAGDLRADVPEELSRLVHRCLEKRVDDRVQTARDVYNELRHVQKQLESGSSPRLDSVTSSATGRRGDLTLAVIPFTARGGDTAAVALAEDLTDAITTGLSRFCYVRVLPRGTGASAHARYVVEGQARRSASSIRVSAKLIDTVSGAQLWAENYDRQADTDIFELQDDVASRVIATVADANGVLVRSMVATLKERPIATLSITELVLRFYGYLEQLGPAEHAILRESFRAALQREPNHASGWACYANLVEQEYSQQFNPLPNAFERSREAAERAIQIDPVCQEAWRALASAAFFARDRAAMRVAAERAIAINPLNTGTVAICGMYLACSGDWDRGLEVTQQAMRRNPHYPGWLHFVPFWYHYNRVEYAEALQHAKQVNMPGFSKLHVCVAAAAGQLGLRDDARGALDALARIDPGDLDPERARAMFAAWLWSDAELDHLIDGFGKAKALVASGIVPLHRPERPVRSPDSAAGLNTDAFVVTVLPFASSAGGGDASELADGLTQGVAVGLSRFSYLRVIRRGGATEPVATGYALNGSVRMAGGVIRVVTQLTETSTGQNLWAETYDRKSAGASIFDLQDELTEKIVATIADVNGALVRAMAVVVRSKPAESLTPYEAVIRALAYFSLLSPDEHAELRTALEKAVERAPNYPDAWSALAFAYSEEYAQSYNQRSQALERSQAAINRALALDSSNQLAYFTLVRLAFFARDRSALRAASDRLIALNPLAPHIISFLGMARAYTGDWETGLAMCERAMALNPHHSGIYRMPFVIDAYRRRDYARALETLDRVNMPSFPVTSLARAAIYAQLGRLDEAIAVWREAESRVPGYSARIHGELSKWFAPDLVAHLEEAVAKIRARSSGVTPSSSASSAGGASIAVLPFADLSAEKNQDWFCDGIAEEILNALTQLPGLRVAAKTSAFSLRDRGADLRVVADQLGVATLLQGSVRRAGDRVRVTVQLVDVGNGFQLWSDRYDRELKDIFDVQDEIARAVADRLKVTLTGATDERLVAKVTSNLESYELLLKGRKLLFKRGPFILDALKSFERAVALDPDLAEAHALIGDAYRLLGLYGIAPTADMMPKARAAAERALAIDPKQVEALSTLANIAAIYDWDIKEALALSGQALAFDPNHIRTLAERSIVITKQGSSRDIVDAALASVRRARELDPLSAWVASVEAYCLHLVDRTVEGVAAARRAVALDGENYSARWMLVWTLSAAGQYEEALAAAETALASSGRSPRILTEIAAIHAARGDRAAADAVYHELVERARTGFVGLAEQGVAAASAGRMSEAMDLVRQAVAVRESYLWFRKLPAWTPFLQHPEGASLLQRMSNAS